MILYKYRPLNQHTVDSIFNNFLYFSKPSSFNDPFDCRFSVLIEGKHYEKVECAKELARLEGSTGRERKRTVREYLNDIINKNIDYDEIYRGIEKVNDKMSICCLSVIPDDLLMWAHYAGGHKGVCLKYDIEDDSLPDCILKRVIYQDDLVKVNFVKPSDDIQIVSVFTTKSKHWEYEQEYRLISRYGYQIVEHKRGCLKGIIFGCKVDTKEKNELINTIKANKFYFSLYEAVQSRERYELTISEL